jgi:predicted nuclease of predicted toxin-antitoxin system
VKLLLDQHFSRKLVPLLQPAYPGSSHVILHSLESSADDALWRFARDQGFTIVSKDEDFQVLSFARGHPPKVIWVRSGNGPSAQVLATLLQARDAIRDFCESAERSLLELP